MGCADDHGLATHASSLLSLGTQIKSAFSPASKDLLIHLKFSNLYNRRFKNKDQISVVLQPEIATACYGCFGFSFAKKHKNLKPRVQEENMSYNSIS